MNLLYWTLRLTGSKTLLRVVSHVLLPFPLLHDLLKKAVYSNHPRMEKWILDFIGVSQEERDEYMMYVLHGTWIHPEVLKHESNKTSQ